MRAGRAGPPRGALVLGLLMVGLLGLWLGARAEAGPGGGPPTPAKAHGGGKARAEGKARARGGARGQGGTPLRGAVQRAAGEPQRRRMEPPATLGVRHGPRLPGSAVYPAQELPLRFDHSRHLARKIPCVRCHDRITASTRAEDVNLPRGVTCDGCHGAQHPRPAGAEAKCAMCHTRARGARVQATAHVPAPLLRFDHRAHLARGTTCADCHGDMSKVRLATTLQLPGEAACLGCHDGMQARSECSSCHPTRGSGQLVTRARDDRVSPPLVPSGKSAWGMAHDLSFVADHAAVAKSRPEACRACHDDDWCLDCHAGNLRPLRIHSGDYLTLHAMDANARTQDCASCHRAQTFCLGCHERLGFGTRSGGAFGVGGGARVHPDGWAGPVGTRQGHAFAAQRNMGACVSCHTEDACLACHATTGAATPGLDANPHGPGFAGSARCLTLEARNRRVCLRCHAPGQPALDCR